MIKIFDLPIVKLPLREEERAEREIRQRLVQQGYTAYTLGWKISNCPPFRVEDMAIAWRTGWRMARDEEEARRKARR